MGEQVYRDVFGHEVVLTDSVRATILQKHPEVSDFIDRIDRALAEPEEVRGSVRDERSVLYYRFEADVLAGKWVVVVVKRIDRHFISTVYATDQIKSGEVIWTKAT
jgi:hypothetical protein